MSSANMTPDSVPPGTEDPDAGTGDAGGAEGAPTPRRRRWWLWGMAGVLVLGAVLGALFVPTPYVLIQPGAVRPAEERIEVTGAPSYDNDGDVLFTTVFVDRATLFGLLRGSLDDAIEVRTQQEVYGDRSRDETKEINRQQMDLSKLVATIEALDQLGYDASFTADGARVLDVDGDADAAGEIRPGDVIVAVDGVAVALPADLRAALGDRAPGDAVTVSVQRPVPPSGESAAPEGGDMEAVEVETVLSSADDDGRAVLGVNVEPWKPRVESEVDVEIDSGAVTGPSAGLAWSLAVIDALTPGSLTGERDVAVTGEITADGSVGVIGGVTQKAATVARNGVDVFLYPADTSEEEQEEMRRIAGDDVELVPVDSLAEAVEYLAPEGLPAPG